MAEEKLQETKVAVHCTQLQGADHRILLRDIQRHVEALDNRGPIRVQGLSELEGSEDLQSILQALFNNLLGEPPTKHIEMDRAHRALRPKGPSSKLQDIICWVHSYPLKEDIMRKACCIRKVVFEDTKAKCYPALSWITLQKRKLLQPLLHTLQEEDIIYRWGFPISLTTKHHGKSAVLPF